MRSAGRPGYEPTHWHDVYAAVSLVDTSVYELGLKMSSLRFLGEPMLELQDLDLEWQALPRPEEENAVPSARTSTRPIEVYRYGCDDPEKTRRLWHHPLVIAAVRHRPARSGSRRQSAPASAQAPAMASILDPDVLTRLISETTTRLQTLQAEIWTLLGEDISLGRKAYLGQALLNLGVPITERTPTGLLTVKLPILERYTDTHPSSRSSSPLPISPPSRTITWSNCGTPIATSPPSHGRTARSDLPSAISGSRPGG